MTTVEDITEIIASSYALARIAAQKTGNHEPAATWRAISVLRREGPLRLGALAEATRTTQPGMTRLVAQMAEQGLIDRSPDPDDSRATILSITPLGDSALREWQSQMRVALAPLFADLDDEDRAHLARTAALLAARTAPMTGAAR